MIPRTPLLAVTLLLSEACATAPAGTGGPPNIVLVSLDTFRADRVGALGGKPGLTPNLDRFAAESIRFTQAYCQSTVTGPSHTSMLTSRFPSEFAGPGRAAELAPEMYTLPEVLGLYGYQTAARVAGGDLNPLIGPTRGFATYESAMDFGSLWHTTPMAIQWLDEADPGKPFFLFVHGYDTHAAYLKPSPFGLLHAAGEEIGPERVEMLLSTQTIADGRLYPDLSALDGVSKTDLHPRSEEGRRTLARIGDHQARRPRPLSDDDLELVRHVYDGAVSYVDAAFGVFMARLAERGRLDDTIVVVMADHGEALGEEGLFHRCCTLEDSADRVPLLVRLPGGEGGGREVSALVALIDVMPTLLELAGAPAPSGVRGTSLVPAIRGEPFAGHDYVETMGGLGLRMVSVRSAKGRLTYTGAPVGSALGLEVLEAARVDGPSFSTTGDLAPTEKDALKAELAGWLRGLAPPPILGESKEMPEELRETLRAKGYWDAQ